MIEMSRLGAANLMTLEWHSRAALTGFESHQTWVLALLKQRLHFDGAVWGLQANVAAAGRRIGATHLHALPSGAMSEFEHARGSELISALSGHVVCHSIEQLPNYIGDRTTLDWHSRQFGMPHSICVLWPDPRTAGRQFVMLTRKTAAFNSAEVDEFGFVAPHMMLSYASSRALFLSRPAGNERRVAAAAVGIFDRHGLLHDQQPSFVSTLRREWADWPGQRLPEPLSELAARRAGSSWRFLGAQVRADFAPLADLYIVTARPRHSADALTPREGEVAESYAAGKNFREIATALQLSPATVRSHLRNVFGKLQIRNKSQLAAVLR